jgi:hypothetical protein|nr:MAG TPA: hypothetical protein [Bacteriophage sp.]
MTTDEHKLLIKVDEDLTELYRMYAEDVSRLARLVRKLAGALLAVTVLAVVCILNIYATLGVI